VLNNRNAELGNDICGRIFTNYKQLMTIDDTKGAFYGSSVVVEQADVLFKRRLTLPQSWGMETLACFWRPELL